MVKYIKQLRKNQKGLTLVELLAVIVILGIVAAIAVPAVGNIIEDSREDAQNANALMILNAARLAEAAGEAQYDNEGKMTLNQLVDTGHLSTIPGNPADNKPYHGTNSFVKKVNGKYSVKLVGSDGTTNVLEKSENELIGGTDPQEENTEG